MTGEKKIARLFKLNNENWMGHANPWSVYTRYTALPLLVLACWTRLWLGWWFLLPTLLAVGWMFLNPVLFKKPSSTNNWASKWLYEEMKQLPEYGAWLY